MAKEFRLPDLGEGIHEAQIINVLVKEGDRVKEDQLVLEVETDKAAVELPVPFAGVITKLNVQVGETVSVGDVMIVVDGDGETAPAAKTREAAAPKVATAPASAGIMGRGGAQVGGDQGVGAMVAEAPHNRSGPVPAAPAVRRWAREQAIDLRRVHGTGPGGRIVREDVERFKIAGPSAPATPSSKPAAAPRTSAPGSAPAATPDPVAAPWAGADEPLPDFSQWGPIRREKVTQIRKTIARQMVRSWSTIPHVTHGDEADVTDLELFRKQHGEVLADQGARLTLTAFIVKAVAGALSRFPMLNASFDSAASEIIYKDYTHIGVAVDSPRGLMVPVIRDVQTKGLLAISQELKEMADKAREFKLDIAQMRGGTFTVTNVGSLGGTVATPMINHPEVAILAVGRLALKPVVRNDEIVPRKILPLFLSFDHRVVDGADGARFMREVVSFLENPLNLLLAS
jgi:pyruvate dehydrogenase E2 component (dihydrolipoamide acetyltransferase)